jgi:hypothetical protein
MRGSVRRALLAALLLALAAPAEAQREGVLQIGDPLSELLVRQKTAGRLPADAPVDTQPLSAVEAARMLDTLATRIAELAPADRALVRRLRGDAPPPRTGPLGALGLYADGVAPVSTRGDGYAIEAAPLLYLAAGPARRTETASRNGEALVYQASRGVRVSGHLGRHLYFETRAQENQRVPALVDFEPARFTTPRLGRSRLVGGDTYDYFLSSGVVGYHDRFVEVRFGRDRNRWGPGVNSMLLSDYAAPYDQLQIRAHAGPLTYTALMARFTTPIRQQGSDAVYPSSYGALHQLGLSLGRVDVQLFEAVIFHDDTLNANRQGFEIGYLNPFIFYRPVESELGSGDNALLGASLAVRPVDGLRAYGQLVLDEFTASRLFDDYWGNKWGLLAGVHAVDLGLSGLELRAEIARLRPYLYSHRSERSAFVHYSDPLGHPAGTNAQDVSVFATYRPTARTEAALSVARTLRGRNPDGVNVGADPRLGYNTRASSDDVPTFGGVRQVEWLVEARAGVEALPYLFVEGALVGQRTDDALLGRTQALAAVLQLRWGLPFRSERF